MISGLHAYKYYTAVKLHFTSDKFNVFENRGHIKCSQDALDKRNDRFIFEKLGRKFNTDKELIQFFASNFIYGNSNVIYAGTESDSNYIEFIRRKQSISRVFEEDCDKIIETGCNVDQLIKFTNNEQPVILSLYLGNIITIETLIILDSILGFINEWKEETLYMMIMGDTIRIIDKSKGFVKFDSTKVLKIWEDKKHDLESYK